MPNFDEVKNFAVGVIQTPPSPSTTGTIFVLTAGQGANFPTPVNGYNCIVWPNPTVLPTSQNCEIIRVTNISGDIFTIQRQQEGTAARQIVQGDYIALVPTAKTLTDIQSSIGTIPSLPLSIANGGTGASTASGARTNLVAQQQSANLDSWSAKTPPSGGVVGDSDSQNLSNKTLINPIWDGWSTITSTLTFGSVDGNTFTATANTDLTRVIQVGDRIKLTNQSATQFFLVTSIQFSSGTTTMTLYGGQNYSITNTPITSPAFSHMKSPFGFPLNPLLWTESFSDTSNRDQTNPTAGTWYNPGTVKLDIPIGSWRLTYDVVAFAAYQTPASTLYVNSAISSNNAGISDSDFQSGSELVVSGGANIADFSFEHTRTKNILLSNKTSYYIIITTASNLGGSGVLRLAGATAPTRITAVSNYL